MIPSETKRATSDIYYEALMLYRAHTEYWIDEASSKRRYPTWIHNSILESTLIRCRSLLEFIESSKSKRSYKDDVLAADYAFPPKTLPVRSDLRQRINTVIAHISYGRSRIPEQEKHWDFASILPEILGQVASFFEHLLVSDHPRSDWPGDDKLTELIASIRSLANKAV